jgi:hypothetical protein
MGLDSFRFTSKAKLSAPKEVWVCLPFSERHTLIVANYYESSIVAATEFVAIAWPYDLVRVVD